MSHNWHISHKIKIHHKGFTLVEILLVMLLISILVLGINAVYSQAHRFWSRINSSQPIYTQTRIFLDALRNELSMLYLPKNQTEEGKESTVFFCIKTAPDQVSELSFLSLNPSWYSTPNISKSSKITYSFAYDANGANTLTRTEQLFSGEKAIGVSQNQIILKNLDGLKFLVLEKDSEDGTWKDNLDSPDKPPKAIKIQLSWPKDKYHDTIQMEAVIPVLNAR